MDRPTVPQPSTRHSLGQPLQLSSALTRLLFSAPERFWRGAKHHWIFERLNVSACVCACIPCGNVGKAGSPRAMLINALQNKCSPFYSFSLSGHCWARRRWVTGLLEARTQLKQEYERKHRNGLRKCGAFLLSPSCPRHFILRAIDTLNSEPCLRLPRTSHANHVQAASYFCVRGQDLPEDPKGSAACKHASLTLWKPPRVCGHPLCLELQRVAGLTV